jgi:hypothetical protein
MDSRGVWSVEWVIAGYQVVGRLEARAVELMLGKCKKPKGTKKV